MTMLPTDPWPVRWTCSEVDTASPAATGIAALAATQILWGLSGQQFGLTTSVLRPCRRQCLPDGGYLPGGLVPWTGWPYPALIGGMWVNLGCGDCGPTCSCTALQEVLLPGRVYDVVAVKQDGASVVSGTGWRLDQGRAGALLVRLDGGVWPTCQSLTKADTQPGTFSVTARYGLPVPELAQLAMGELACEFLKGMAGKDCRLPEHVTSLARQGVTLNFPDPTELLTAGKLGLVMADRFIQAVNPDGRRRRARTWSPDQVGLRQVGA